MARKLKTFQTSLGFYGLAMVAPSMKAVLGALAAITPDPSDNALVEHGPSWESSLVMKEDLHHL
jgi:hypothetical protein